MRASSPLLHPPSSTAAALVGGATPASPVPRITTNARILSSLATLFVPLQAQDASGAYCPGTGAPPMTVQQLEAAIFEEVSPNQVTVGSTYNRCTQGQLRLTRGNSRVVDPVVLPCNGTVPRTNAYWNVSSCPFAHFMAWADEADRIMVQERKIDLAAHPFRVYLTPTGSCDFIGLGFLGCDYKSGCRVWIGSGSWHVQQALVHELGHNLFMHHAGSYTDSGLFDEYSDNSCAMGYCCENRCFNTPHMWQQGWLSAAEFDRRNLGRGQTITLTLAAQGTPSDGRYRAVRVVPSWVPAFANGSAAVDPLFIGYRTGLGVDASLYDTMKNHVLLYTSPVKTARDPQYTTRRAALKGKTVWNYDAADLVVRTQALTRDAAQISICRQAPGRQETAASCAKGLDYNCDGRVGPADPQCLPFMNLNTPLNPPLKTPLKPPRRKARRRGRSLERKPNPGH
ncbi:hypothetical protein C2E21_2437 [Chlorella sorokiniana]|uniref:Peptidase M11 gametolysin domain-containing protein n=1 Tax=Chlorella sorokiniana TaxID=3076 RepID=A0A2P6TZ59_CHLSO|nr:hypothetical protein C2E21_2437 [Chlorella sorokiniana]|eukprot:PRW59320.1 hypothetical protein C2E21_2437 [Chlorella sorokiniana]